MGDVGDDYRALREHRRQERRRLGIACPRCEQLRPKAEPSILLPGQKCRVDGYVAPRKGRTDDV